MSRRAPLTCWTPAKKRNAADVLAIEGEKSTTLLAAMVRTVWQYRNRPDRSWSGGAASVTNHQTVQTLEANPGLRHYVAVGNRVAAETGMIRSAAGAAAYLVDQANPREKTKMAGWHQGIAEGAGLDKSDPRLISRKAMFAMARKQAGVVQRRRDNREHVVHYLKAFNAWADAAPLDQLRYAAREPAPAIMKVV